MTKTAEAQKAAADKIAEARTARRAAKFAARQQEIKDLGLTFKTIGQTHRENMEAKEATTTTRSFQWEFSS